MDPLHLSKEGSESLVEAAHCCLVPALHPNMLSVRKNYDQQEASAEVAEVLVVGGHSVQSVAC